MIILKNNNYNNSKLNTYNKQVTYTGKKNNNTYLLHPNYEETCLICSVNMKYIKIKRGICF